MQVLEVVPVDEPGPRPEGPPLADWPLAGGADDARATLYRTPDGFEFWATDAGTYRIFPERGRIEIPSRGDAIVHEQRLWGIPTTLCYQHRGDLSLHAAAVEIDGRAVILAAPSRYGKTTLALAFHEHGHRVLSEDLTCCRPGSEPAVLPGPAVLRIRPDVYPGQPPHGTHVIAARPDRVYLGLDERVRGASSPVPLRAIVFLREAPEGRRMERAAPAIALADLWHLNFRLQSDEGRAQSFRQLASVVDRVPAWNLYRPLELGSLGATVAMIAAQVHGAMR